MSANRMHEAQVIRASFAAMRTALMAGVLLAPLLTGCRAAMPSTATQPVVVPTDTNAELVVYISDLPFVTAEAAYRAVHILSKGDIFEGDFAALQAEMETAGLIAPGWHYDAASFVDRAAVGHLIARACEIRSGMNWRLFGLGRYAWRELVHRRIAHVSGEYSLISGGEFLGVLARAEEYLHNVDRAPSEAAELGDAPGS